MLYNTQNFKLELKKIEDWLSKEYFSIHTGRATPMILDSVMIENYGNKMPLKNVAQVSIEDPKTLRIIPWDKNQIKSIETAVTNANLGLSVISDGEGLRVIFPMLTTENRLKLVKVLKEKHEDARIRVRQQRQEEIENTNELSEDDKKRAKEDIQKMVDDSNNNLEIILNKKEKEVMG
jgi:ribosome recycling factor